ncbi:MAG: 50S ribosomal protein L16 [Candidatus Shikimatogenerans sp. AspAUS03]|uniref:50S ribosomal protein L16 n=1 Tax=Candidatus Shikimatogenerans sp. AspAUS03 TaxID=3158563 RepID=A0AAU7QV69_9FLAO
MLEPKKIKHLKVQKNILKGPSTRGTKLIFGNYGIKSIDKFKFITQKQIESARISISKFLRNNGKLFIKIFPYKPITKKPQEVRMGKGKGAFEMWVSPVRSGKIIFELKNMEYLEAKKALIAASHKLPIKTKFIYLNYD